MPEQPCPFCQIISGKIPAMKVYEDSSTLAILDINPRNPGHTLIVPKKHIETIMDFSDSQASEIFSVVRKVAEAVKNGTKAEGISISQSNGRAAGQLVPHMHVHIIPRFMSEGPISLEGVLPVKKLDKPSMDAVLKSIKDGFGKRAEKAKPKEESEEKLEGEELDNLNLEDEF